MSSNYYGVNWAKEGRGFLGMVMGFCIWQQVICYIHVLEYVLLDFLGILGVGRRVCFGPKEELQKGSKLERIVKI